MSSAETSTGARTRARHLALQALYQWQLTGQDPLDIRRQFLTDNELTPPVAKHFEALISKVVAEHEELDSLLDSISDRPVAQLDPVEHGILWVALCEFRHFIDVPYKAVINEAIEACKLYGATDGHKFVNALLDKAARNLRAVEFG